MEEKEQPEKEKEEETQHPKGELKTEEDNFMAAGMCLGMSFGGLIGWMLFDDYVIGMCIGLLLGLVIGMPKRKKK